MLNDEQKNAAYQISGDVLVSASPGTGKTRTLVARAKRKLDELSDYKSIALITYTNAAADEIAARLITEKNMFTGTIHRFCLEYILRPYSWLYKWKKPRVVTYDEQIYFSENTEGIDLGDNTVDNLGKISLNTDGGLNEDIDWRAPTELSTVAEEYFAYLEKIGAIDFNQILYRSYKIITENPFVATSLASCFMEILVDEFQDTNEFQYEIFKHIKNAGSTVFFMVGDERQSIYRFAGAIEDAFSRAEPDFAAENAYLTTTYRSTHYIVEAFSKLFEAHPVMSNEAEHKDLDSKVIFRHYQNETKHAELLTNAVNYFVNTLGIDPMEVAVLSQRWGDAYGASRVLRTTFDIVGLGALPHPTKNLGNSTFHLMRAICNFTYKVEVRSLRSIKRCIDLHALENNLQLSETGKDRLCNALVISFQSVDLSLSLEKGLMEFESIFNNVFGITHSTFGEILSRIDNHELLLWNVEKYVKTLSGVGGITSNTIHQAKGLEYDVVILNNMSVGRIPFQLWNFSTQEYEPATPEEIEDGRKLFYVATSRAKKSLVIMHKKNRPSIFVTQLRTP